jgi:hypothetical protein
MVSVFMVNQSPFRYLLLPGSCFATHQNCKGKEAVCQVLITVVIVRLLVGNGVKSGAHENKGERDATATHSAPSHSDRDPNTDSLPVQRV